jgi:UDP:flavonoid glycosyltransferase YjiC (YdhE family)
MPTKKVLFLSGSIGLGHITRDLVIASELRRQNPDIEIFWLAAHPASMLIKNSGEKLLPESEFYANENITAENSLKNSHLNLLNFTIKIAIQAWIQHIKIIRQVSNKEKFDLIIGDEYWELYMAFHIFPKIKQAPFVMIFDFIGLNAVTKSPFEKLGIYLLNILWVKLCHRIPSPIDLELFVGEPGDVPDQKFGFLLPNRSDWAKERCKFTGYVLPFDPIAYADRLKVKEKLGYGSETLIICSLGGTSIGKALLELCGQAYQIIKNQFPDVRMILACGPRLCIESVKVPDGVEVRGYIPNIYEHFAACDLAIVQGGGTSTLELTALKRPFIYFPIEQHFEQEVHVASRLDRHRAGIKMIFSKTTPESLAETAIANLGKETNYLPIPTRGAQKAAELINQLLK